MRGYLKFNSFLTTAGIFAIMAAYLLRGKYFVGGLDPKVMLAFACLLIIQGGVVLVARARLLSRTAPVSAPARIYSQGVPFPGPVIDATQLLVVSGLRPLYEQDGGNSICYGKGVRLALMFEVVAYTGLLIALVSGTVNFGLGIRGYVMVAPSTAWVELESNIQMVQQGFMVDRTALPSKVKITELSNGKVGKRPQIRFEIAGGGDKTAGIHTLASGDALDVGKIRLRFIGDTYMVFSYMTKKGLDFQSEPVYLHRQAKGGSSEYRGTLKLNQPGATGVMTYDPASSRFRVLLYDKGRLVLDRAVAQGEVGRQGEYAVQITGLGHFGRIDIMRHSYRNQIFAGLIIMAGAVVVRLFCRPLRVWLWSEDGKTLFYTRNRRLRKLLAGFQGGD